MCQTRWDPSHTLVVVQELGNGLGILTMARHTQVERLETKVQQEGIVGRGNRTQVTHQLCRELGHIGQLTKLLGVGQSVVGLVGRAETRELVFARR